MNGDEETNITSMQNIPKDILEDLCSRFLINIPEEERNDLVRMCFQIELAHWFYLDFYRQEDPALPGCGLQRFLQIIFSAFPFLNKSNSDLQDIYTVWKKYKLEVPVFGAILLDESLEHCVLVRGFHKRISWGFPKGKVNKDENGDECAIREVKEETGMDITNYIDPNEYIERSFHDHQIRLYIVPAIPLNSDFEPKTRGEIAEIKWFAINSLPVHKKDSTPREKLGLNASSFFMVQSFVKDLRKWVVQKKQKIEQLLFAGPMSIPIFEQSLAPIRKIDNTQMLREQEEHLRRRKEEEQRKFQELHLLAHPLLDDHGDNEQKLKDLLGLRDSPPTHLKKASKKPSQKSERAAKDQPEAIRKLLSGTLPVSPQNTPERRLGQGFGSPDVLVEDRRSSPGVASPNSNRGKRGSRQEAQYSSPANLRVSSPACGRDYVDFSRGNMHANMHVDKGGRRYSLELGNDLNSSKSKSEATQSELRTVGNRKLNYPVEESQGFNAVNPQIFGRENSAFRSYKEEIRKISNKKELSFQAPGFTNFRFDRKALMATLPSATVL